MTLAINAKSLVKHFGTVEAVRGIDLAIEPGEMFGFLGPNGAGKSTTINMLCTLAEPTSGSAEVAGFDVVRNRTEVRRRIGLVFQDPTLDTYLSADQNLEFHSELYGIDRAAADKRRDDLLAMMELTDRRTDAVSTFSGGMRRRLEIARGLLHSPAVLFLDEPTIGLDPATRVSIWNYVKELNESQHTTVFVTTHYMDEAEHCDRIAIVDGGRIVALDTPANLKQQVGSDRVTIVVDNPESAIAKLKSQFDVDAFAEGTKTHFFVDDGASFVPRLLREADLAVQSIEVKRPSLDDVFLFHTGRTMRDEGAGPNHPMAFMRGRR